MKARFSSVVMSAESAEDPFAGRVAGDMIAHDLKRITGGAEYGPVLIFTIQAESFLDIAKVETAMRGLLTGEVVTIHGKIEGEEVT